MLDVCKFLNSRDVTDSLREIGYEFTAPEAAFIVYRSNDATLDEKIAAWQEIAETMPDCSMEGRPNMDPIPSFRAFLHDYIDLQKRMLAWFAEPGECVYSIAYSFVDDWEQDEGVFGDTKNCLAYLRSCFGKRWCQEEAPPRYMIEKRPVNRPGTGKSGKMLLNASLEVLAISRAHLEGADLDLALQFDGMWFSFPTPFKRGDIVTPAANPSGLYVIDKLPTWGKADCVANGFHESDWHAVDADATLERLRNNGGITDMDARGYFASVNDEIWCECTDTNYLDLKYRKSLFGFERWAWVVSAYLNEEIDFCLAWNLLHQLRVESLMRSTKPEDGFVCPPALCMLPKYLRFDEKTRKWTHP